MKMITILIPAYNEEDNVEKAIATVSEQMQRYQGQYDYEILFTDNHSEDNTFSVLQKHALKNPKIKVVRFSRNFGYQKSIYTGYLLASGDAAIQLDCDLQDPPEMIHDFIARWQEGYAVVYGVRKHRAENFFITSLRKIFYRIIDYLSHDNLPHDAGDFRLVDRKVIDVLRKIYDYSPYIRGSIASFGFKQLGIEYERRAREKGKSKFSMSSLFNLAIDGILNHSIVPLRLATFIGLIVFCFSTLLGSTYIICKVMGIGNWPAGFATTLVLILMSIALNALFLGIIGEYLGRIYQQTKGFPITIVEEVVNLEQPKN